jgi:hypothetical protein
MVRTVPSASPIPQHHSDSRRTLYVTKPVDHPTLIPLEASSQESLRIDAPAHTPTMVGLILGSTTRDLKGIVASDPVDRL